MQTLTQTQTHACGTKCKIIRLLVTASVTKTINNEVAVEQWT